ncbi:MAG: OprO/OprP family phosphate-selective porin [Gammaproteobacteria bacterium]|nr:OprO/OprP family phosphate-selective porin [Gammaproteobacteria bacterium]
MARNLSGNCLLAASVLLGAATAQAQDWKDTLKNMGKLYSSDDGFVQEVKIFGRVHYQYNYSDGDLAGENFNGDREELRRLRAGMSIKFLDGFRALARWNVDEQGFKGTAAVYDSWDELYLDYTHKNVLGFDKATVGYGRYKLLFGGEEHLSSKKIKTIERSAINNRFGSRRPTGVNINLEKGDVEYIVGIWSTEVDLESWAGWDEDVAFQASAILPAAEGELILDFIYADNADKLVTPFNYDWAGSVTYTRKFGDVSVLTNATVSEARKADPYGFVILPSFFIVDDKLEAAFRYQYAGVSTDSGVPRSSGSRGLRRVALAEGVGTGNGDEYQAIYAGLNYYVAGENLKFMTGVEYEDISGDPDRDLSGVTLWAAVRAYF